VGGCRVFDAARFLRLLAGSCGLAVSAA